MPLPLPNLDDKTYQQLVDEAIGRIPVVTPEWTNYNASDPGITLLELFAWYTEALLYRNNRVTSVNTQAFLRLLNGPDWKPAPGQTLQDQIRQTVLALRTPQRAVTAADFEALALMADPSVARVRAFPRMNLDVIVAGSRAGRARIRERHDCSSRGLDRQPAGTVPGTVTDGERLSRSQETYRHRGYNRRTALYNRQYFRHAGAAKRCRPQYRSFLRDRRAPIADPSHFGGLRWRGLALRQRLVCLRSVRAAWIARRRGLCPGPDRHSNGRGAIPNKVPTESPV